jgi:TPR repeat protein
VTNAPFVGQKAAQARVLLEKACNIGYNPGCDNLGQFLQNGLGVKLAADIRRAFPTRGGSIIFLDGCENCIPDSCRKETNFLQLALVVREIPPLLSAASC